jgi:hypothetical protein
MLAARITAPYQARCTMASIHNHLLDNEPQLVFMHFWAYRDALDLAKGLRAALDRIGS